MTAAIKKVVLVGSILALSAFALAKVYGPFFISAAGPDYAQITLSSDAEAE